MLVDFAWLFVVGTAFGALSAFGGAMLVLSFALGWMIPREPKAHIVYLDDWDSSTVIECGPV